MCETADAQFFSDDFLLVRCFDTTKKYHVVQMYKRSGQEWALTEVFSSNAAVELESESTVNLVIYGLANFTRNDPITV
jgi:hypothetical protein